MKRKLVLTGVALAMATLAEAQWQQRAQEPSVPLQNTEERKATADQSRALFAAVTPATREAAPSAVWVWADGRQVAMGTVVGDGTEVLTKWSQIAFARESLQVVGADKTTGDAEVSGVYQDDDLALLKITGAKFTPISLADTAVAPVGQFLVAVSPAGSPLQIGVVSVAQRSLRDSDQPFLGIGLDPEYSGEGVRVERVEPETGAAVAGIRTGDILTGIDGTPVKSAYELRVRLLQHQPGDRIKAAVLRESGPTQVEILLGGRPEYQQVPESRLRGMRSMGTQTSLVGRGFPVVLQTDMELRPDQCGGPVVGLDGKTLGISISRTDRTRGFVIPTSHVAALLQQKPVDPALAVRPNTGRQRRGRRGWDRGSDAGAEERQVIPMNPGSADRMRQSLEEMSRLLERMEQEMHGLGR